MTPRLYFLIGVIYADIILINNMFNMPDYDDFKFIEKLGYYIGDFLVWPLSLIGSTVLYFVSRKGE